MYMCITIASFFLDWTIELGYQKIVFFFFKILFIHERHRERGRDTGRVRSRLPTESLMWDSNSGPPDHDLSQRQTLKEPPRRP